MPAADNFARVLGHAGWGDPIGGLWFIGIEEGSAWKGGPEVVDQWFDQNAITALGDMTYESCPAEGGLPAASGSRVRYWEQAIFDRLRAHHGNTSPPPPLWSPGSRVFHTNLYPLARYSVASWPDYFETLFGVASAEVYRQAVHAQRFAKLRGARKQAAPQAIVCFGKAFWPEFAALLGLDPESARFEAEGKLKCYDAEKVICTPFFGYWHMKSSLADVIATILDSWKVEVG